MSGTDPTTTTARQLKQGRIEIPLREGKLELSRKEKQQVNTDIHMLLETGTPTHRGIVLLSVSCQLQIAHEVTDNVTLHTLEELTLHLRPPKKFSSHNVERCVEDNGQHSCKERQEVARKPQLPYIGCRDIKNSTIYAQYIQWEACGKHNCCLGTAYNKGKTNIILEREHKTYCQKLSTSGRYMKMISFAIPPNIEAKNST